MTAADYNWPESQTVRDLRATIARVEVLADRWDGLLAEVLADSPSAIFTDRSVITIDTALRELRAALEPR